MSCLFASLVSDMERDWICWPIAPWAYALNNLYWRLRQVRQDKDRRKWYRRIEVEKAAVLERGIDPELVRLVCRYFKNPNDAARVLRIEARESALIPESVEEFTGRQILSSGVGRE